MLITFIKAFSAIFGVMDPVGNVPVFLSLTEKFDQATRQKLGTKAVLRAAVILLIVVFFGNVILDFFRISLQSFRIAGGVILVLIGLQILFGIEFNKKLQSKIDSDDISAIPIATPLIAGPGTITTIIIFSKEYGYLTIILAVGANLLLSWFLFRYAHYVLKLLGRSGAMMFAKFMSLILVAIGVEFIKNAIGF